MKGFKALGFTLVYNGKEAEAVAQGGQDTQGQGTLTRATSR